MEPMRTDWVRVTKYGWSASGRTLSCPIRRNKDGMLYSPSLSNDVLITRIAPEECLANICLIMPLNEALPCCSGVRRETPW